MTTSSFKEAQKELLRILTHHMIVIAERAGILETQGADCPLPGNADRLWSGKAVFKWDLVQLGAMGEHDKGYQSSADYCPVQNHPELEARESEGEQSLQSIDSLKTSHIYPLSDIAPPDSQLDTSNSLLASVLDDPTLSRCFACDNALDANGLCQICPPGILFDVNQTCPIDPFGSQGLSQNQTSENIFLSPFIADSQDWSAPLNFGM